MNECGSEVGRLELRIASRVARVNGAAEMAGASMTDGEWASGLEGSPDTALIEKDGKPSTFSCTDAGLGNVADFSGIVLGELAGKGAEGEFKE